MSDKQSWTQVSALPIHTRKEVVFGKIIDLKQGRNVSGFSTSAKLTSPPPYGYIVGTSSRGNEINVTELSGTEIRSKVNQLFTECEGKADLYIGGWASNTGEAVVEVSEWINGKALAVEIGRERGQYSIWDCYENVEIVL